MTINAKSRPTIVALQFRHLWEINVRLAYVHRVLYKIYPNGITLTH